MDVNVPYYDVHTHRLSATDDEVIIQNVDSKELFSTVCYSSVGIHPWKANDLQSAELLSLANEKSVLAIGECGLDKVCTTPMSLQKNVFEKQIQLANQLKKPLIIHCVKAHEEVLSCLKKMENTQEVVFHGFNKNAFWMNRLVDEGYYLSVGKALRNETFRTVFKEIPLERLFLETDDSEQSIQENYLLASELLKVSELELKNQIALNFAQVFDL